LLIGIRNVQSLHVCTDHTVWTRQEGECSCQSVTIRTSLGGVGVILRRKDALTAFLRRAVEERRCLEVRINRDKDTRVSYRGRLANSARTKVERC
jgi:hypothetical protein